MSKKGNLLFAKYAYSPNKLGYCGPSKHRAIFDYCVANQTDENLTMLLENFGGAFPYLKLIASSNGINDVFDERVVEAYWIGNELLSNVAIADFYNSIKIRFKEKINSSAMKWLLTKPPIGAKPHHSFHVLDVYTKTGLSKGNSKNNVLETVNNCLILCGKIVKIKNDKIKIKKYIVEYHPIVLKDGKLCYGKKITKELLSPFVKLKVEDYVSFHWDNVCEVLTKNEVNNLHYWTTHHLDIANKTI